jgi:putative effector of murein hydrolase
VVQPAAIQVASTSGQAIVGILQNNPQLAEAAQVMVHGVSKAVIGAAITSIGTILTTNASGQLINAASGNFGVAKSLQAGASSGQVIAVLLYGYGKQ